MNTADTDSISCMINGITNFDLEVTLITPGGVPGVLYQPVFQAAGLVSAVADKENGMVNWGQWVYWVVIIIFFIAVFCIDDSTRVGVNIPVVGRKSDGKRLILNCKLDFLTTFFLRNGG